MNVLLLVVLLIVLLFNNSNSCARCLLVPYKLKLVSYKYNSIISMNVHHNADMHISNTDNTNTYTNINGADYDVNNNSRYNGNNNDNDNDNSSDNESNNNIDNETSLKETMIEWIKWYKRTLSPLMPPNCRFLPTCSSYGIESIEKFGPWKGGILTAWRIMRCNPFGGSGYDPPRWPPPSFRSGTNTKKFF